MKRSVSLAIGTFAALILSFAPVLSSAEDSSLLGGWWSDDSTLDLGVRIGQSKIEVRDSDNTKLGELSSVSVPAPTFVLSSPFNTFGRTHFGYKFKTGFSWFTIEKQNVNGELVDLDTSATGYTASITPMVGYLLGDPVFQNGRGRSLLLGVGIGAGYVIASGDIIFTESTGQERHTFDFNQLTYAIQLALETRWNDWNFEVQVGGPSINEDDFKYDIFDISLHLARTFRPVDFSSSHSREQSGNERRHVLSFYFGLRDLPILSNSEFQDDTDKESSGGGGIQYAYRPKNWPFSIAADFSYYDASPVSSISSLFSATDTPQDVTLEGTLLENHLGILGEGHFTENWSWSLGGGLATFYTRLEGSIDATAVEDSSVDFGYWLGAGAARSFGSRLQLFVQVRFVSVQTELLDVFEENTKDQLRLGMNWKF